MRRSKLTTRCFLLVAAMLFAVAIRPAIGAEDIKPRTLVDYARLTIDKFVADPDMTWVRAHMRDAKGVLISLSAVR